MKNCRMIWTSMMHWLSFIPRAKKYSKKSRTLCRNADPVQVVCHFLWMTMMTMMVMVMPTRRKINLRQTHVEREVVELQQLADLQLARKQRPNPQPHPVEDVERLVVLLQLQDLQPEMDQTPRYAFNEIWKSLFTKCVKIFDFSDPNTATAQHTAISHSPKHTCTCTRSRGLWSWWFRLNASNHMESIQNIHFIQSFLLLRIKQSTEFYFESSISKKSKK